MGKAETLTALPLHEMRHDLPRAQVLSMLHCGRQGAPAARRLLSP